MADCWQVELLWKCHFFSGTDHLLSESIAESAGRPLLSLTCGDIGTVEKTAEEKLSKWFRLAEIWGAVMLIDEADIYLEKRATSDLSRNSLVSSKRHSRACLSK